MHATCLQTILGTATSMSARSLLDLSIPLTLTSQMQSICSQRRPTSAYARPTLHMRCRSSSRNSLMPHIRTATPNTTTRTNAVHIISLQEAQSHFPPCQQRSKTLLRQRIACAPATMSIATIHHRYRTIVRSISGASVASRAL